jgi:hypothetical protein
MTILTMEQGTPEWFAARLGRVTGSRAKDVLATIKSGEAAARRDYRVELVTERLTGQPQDDGFVSKDMQRGTDLEPEAFAAYEAETGVLVRRTGFIALDHMMIGCSLDGDVDNLAGLIEIKCPKMATHYRYLMSANAPPEHRAQMLHNVWVTGAAWCDFVSYDPRFPEGLRLVIRRVTFTPEEIAAYADAVSVFLAEVDRDELAARSLMKAVA